MLKCKEFKKDDLSIKVVLDFEDIQDLVELPDDVYLFNEYATDALQDQEVAFHLGKNFLGATTFDIEDLNKRQLESFLDKVLTDPASLLKKGKIESNAFSGILVKEFVVSEDSQFYATNDKNLVSKDQTTLISHHYTDIQEITLDSACKRICEHALSSLEELNYINLNSIEEFTDDSASCPFSSLQQEIVIDAPNLKKLKLSDRVKYASYIDNDSMLSNAILVFKHIPKNLPSFYYVRMLHGFYLHQDEFNDKEKKAYEKLLVTYKYDFYTYIAEKDIDADLVNKDRVFNLIKDEDDSKLSQKELTKKLEFLVLYGDFETLQSFLDKNKEFECSARALAFALRYRDSSIVKLLLDNNFGLSVTLDEDLEEDEQSCSYYSEADNLVLSLVLDELASFTDFGNEAVIINNDFYNDKAECCGLEVESLDERLKSLDYLYSALQHDRSIFDTLYFYSLCFNQEKMANYLYDKGIRLNGTIYGDLLTNDMDRDYDFINLISNAIPLLYKYTQLENIKIHLTENDTAIIYSLSDFDNKEEVLSYFEYEEDCAEAFIKEAISSDEYELVELLLKFFDVDDPSDYLDFAEEEGACDEIIDLLS